MLLKSTPEKYSQTKLDDLIYKFSPKDISLFILQINQIASFDEDDQSANVSPWREPGRDCIHYVIRPLLLQSKASFVISPLCIIMEQAIVHSHANKLPPSTDKILKDAHFCLDV